MLNLLIPAAGKNRKALYQGQSRARRADGNGGFTDVKLAQLAMVI
jgi:hypothetical protein